MALETMLRHHLDVHATDNSGRTALHVAAYSGDIKCVEILLNYGAGVDALDEINHTPLFRACEMGYFDVVNVLMKSKINRTARIAVTFYIPLHNCLPTDYRRFVSR